LKLNSGGPLEQREIAKCYRYFKIVTEKIASRAGNENQEMLKFFSFLKTDYESTFSISARRPAVTFRFE